MPPQQAETARAAAASAATRRGAVLVFKEILESSGTSDERVMVATFFQTTRRTRR
jgi:hypothetical protein